MQAIAGSVGEGGTNTAADVALVQVALMKVQRPNGAGAYLAAYDGSAGAGTIAAIRQFRTDRAPAQAGTPAAAQIAPGDGSWATLSGMVPAAFQNARVLPGGKTVYLAATAQQRDAKLAHAATITFAPAFRTKINAYINRMHALYGIASGVCPDGGRRNFQDQYVLVTSGRRVTRAGPGESNHNFGFGADMGFAGLRWLRSDGTMEENEGPWLARLTATSAAQADIFWSALRTVGTSPEVGAFPSNLAGDKPHLQNWSDNGVSMTRSLATHLTRSGRMRWGRANVYQSDLGLGGALYPVGTATQIWAGNATIDANTLTRARAAAPQRPALEPADGFAQLRAARNGARPATIVPNVMPQPRGRATAEDAAAMRRALRAEFDRADQNWQAWRP